MHHAVFDYNITQWLLFFYIYCFIGWVFESTVVSVSKRRLVNRGFLHGPYLPLYGSGAVLMLFVSIPVENNWVLVYLSGCVAATALEYVTGVCMEALFKVRYWDYSNKKFNFQGQICLSSTLAWGGLTLLLVYVIHKPIEQFVLGLPARVISPVTYVITVVFAVDMALSFKAAMELRSVLAGMTAVREKLEVLQRRADAILAFAQGGVQERRGESGGRVRNTVDRLESVVGRLESYKASLGKYREELESLKQRFGVLKERRYQIGSRLNYYSRSLIRNNPTATSRHFREALAELQEEVRKKRTEESETE